MELILHSKNSSINNLFEKWRILIPLAVLCVILAPTVRGSESPKNVFVLYDENRDLPGLAVLNQSLKTTFQSASPLEINLYIEGMDLARFSNDGYHDFLRDYYRRKYSGKKIDLLIAVMGPSLDFLLRTSEEIFPGTPIVFCGIDRHEIEGRNLGANVTGVLIERKFKETLDIALTLQPETRQAVVIAGTSSFDRHLLEAARREFREYDEKVKIRYMTNQSLKEMLLEVAHLPAHTIILCLTVFRDAAGEAYVPHEVISRISQSANAPVYGFLDQFLGRGIVGGHLYSMSEHGNKAAELGLRILTGEKPTNIPFLKGGDSINLFDARQLKRWGIGEDRLPFGSIVEYRSQSYWNQHKWEIIGAISVCLVEGLLIGGLLVQLARRRRVEMGLRESEGKYSTLVETTDTGYMIIDQEERIIDANHEYVRLTGHVSLDQIRGRPVREWIAPHDLAHQNQSMKDCARLGYIRGLELEYIHPDGKVVPLEINGTMIKGTEGVRIVCLCRDITERKQEQDQMRLLQTIAMEVSAARDISSALEVVVRRVCQKTGWVFGQTWIPSQDGSVLECSREWYSGTAGLENFRVASERSTFTPGIGLPGRVWLSKQPVWIHDLTVDANFPRTIICLKSGLRAALGIPIISDNEVIAVIEFFLREPRPEDELLVKVITAASVQLSLVIERKQAEAKLLESHARIKDLAGRLIVAQEEERRHIARELHDGLNQQLVAVAIGLSRVVHYLPNIDSSVRHQLLTLEERTKQLSDRIRQISHQLHSSTLEYVGLVDALNLFCSELAEQEGINVDLEIRDGVGIVPPEMALCLYRIAQESLRNVAKHSGSKTARVTLASDDANIEMCVTDSGVGFEMHISNERRGLGLVSMEERVSLLGGNFELRSRPGAGTSLKVRIPLPPIGAN